MRPQVNPLFGSDGCNEADQTNERLYRYGAAGFAVYGLYQLRVRRWMHGIFQFGLGLLWLCISWRERSRRS